LQAEQDGLEGQWEQGDCDVQPGGEVLFGVFVGDLGRFALRDFCVEG
jgi:hypothetical protein